MYDLAYAALSGISAVLIVFSAVFILGLIYMKKEKKQTQNANNPITPPKRISRLSKSCSFYQNVSSENRSQYRDNSFYTRVVGVTFGNAQQVLPNLCAGMDLQFIREPDNQYDRNAIRVECCGSTLGHIKADIAAQLAPKIDSGKTVIKGDISEITGGFAPGITYGCNIRIVAYTKKHSEVSEKFS